AGVEGVLGSSFDDRVEGNDGDNVIQGLDGNDQIFGAGGNDDLRGGAGADEIHGGDGTDTVYFEDSDGSADRIYGDGGGDYLRGGDNDFVDGGDGDDGIAITGSSGTFLGGAGNDQFGAYLGAGDVRALTGLTVDGGAGNDSMFIADTNNLTFVSLTGIDYIRASWDNGAYSSITLLNTTDLSSAYFFGKLHIQFAGDRSSYSVVFGDAGVTVVDLAAAADGDDGTDLLHDIETLVFKNGETIELQAPAGTEGPDTINGTIGPDTIYGLGGDDIIA